MVGLETVIQLVESHGLLLLAPLSVLEGPIVTVIAGYLVSLSLLNGMAAFVVVVVGDLVGDAAMYGAGRFGTGWLSRRWRDRLGLKEERIERLAGHFRDFGGRTLIFGKLTHSAGAVILVAAGAARMPFAVFLWYNLLGTLPKSLLFLLIGYGFGSAYASIDNWIFRGSLVLLGVAVVGGGIWFHRRGRSE